LLENSAKEKRGENLMNKYIQLLVLLVVYYSTLIGLVEKPCVIVIPSRNNQDFCIRNLDSVFSQQYENYRVIYIDDASEDDTYEIVKSYIKKCNQEHRVTLIRNNVRRGAMANHYMAGWMCEDHEIIIQLDGDDWFAHDRVLQRVNQEYLDHDVWLTYGQYQMYPSGKRGHCQALPEIVVKRKLYREYQWVTSALRTFYAGLFKCIRLQDFLNRGQFFSTTCDLAIMFPMLEMAGSHVRFIDEVLYIYNSEVASNDHTKFPIDQRHNDLTIRVLPKYDLLEEPPYSKKRTNDSVVYAMIVSSDSRLLAITLQSLYKHAQNLAGIIVFIDAKQLSELKTLTQKWPEARFVLVDDELSVCIEKTINNIPATHILWCNDSDVLTNAVDMNYCANMLEKTHAHGFFLSLGTNIEWNMNLRKKQKLPPYSEIDDQCIAWQFSSACYEWHVPYSMSMVLYRKNILVDAFGSIASDRLSDIIATLNQRPWKNEVGICFKQAKAVHVVIPCSGIVDHVHIVDQLAGKLFPLMCVPWV
jgi:glycosyltransferase involved in cell wall biosynthesis